MRDGGRSKQGSQHRIRREFRIFCSESCSKKFEVDPRRVLATRAEKDLAGHAPSVKLQPKFEGSPIKMVDRLPAPGAIYTCPMHPQIEQVCPGDCPTCGMDLERKVVEAVSVGSESVLSRIVQMVADAQRSRAPIQKLVDLVAAYFVPAVSQPANKNVPTNPLLGGTVGSRGSSLMAGTPKGDLTLSYLA